MEKQRKKFAKDSVFMQTLLILLALFLFLLLSFWGTLNQVMRKNYEKRMEETSVQLLRQTSEMTELALQLIVEDLDQLIWDDAMLSYLIAPQSNSSQSEYEILLLLDNLKQSSNLVHSVWLYDPSEEWVLSSDGFIGPAKDHAHHQVMEQYVPSTQASSKQESNRSQLVFLSSSHPFSAADLTLTKHIGSLFLEYDFSRLYYMVNLENPGNPIYYMDSKGNVIAPEGHAQELKEIAGMLEKTSSGMVTKGNVHWCYTYNEKTDWYFLQKLESATQQAILKEYVQIILPGMLFFIILGIWGVYIVTRRIYAPINQLVRLVLMHGEGDAMQKKDELSYLELSFMQTMDEKKNLQDSMKFWEKDILEQVFRKLLQGSALEDTGIEMLNQEVKAAWEQSAQYQVLVCHKEHDSKVTTVADLDVQLFVQSIEKIVTNNKGIDQSFVVSMGQDFVAIILSDAEKSAFQFKKSVEKLEEDILLAYRASAFSVTVSHGKVYTHLEDLIYSWQEGVQQIRYARYLEKSPELVPEEPIRELTAEGARSQYYEERARQILDHLLKEQQKQAEDLLGRVVEEVASSEESFESKKKYFESIQGIFLEKKLMVAGQDEEEASLKASEIQNEDDLKEVMTNDLKQQMELILRGTRKNSYRYVESALRYIQENCSNSDLSSQMVAEYLHINNSYFSEIFNKQMQESFTSYLNRTRIMNAKKMLIASNLPVYDIGFKCGFTTVQHFNRTFKKIIGMTPKQYRDSEKG